MLENRVDLTSMRKMLDLIVMVLVFPASSMLKIVLQGKLLEGNFADG